jgi:hypothetical protein
MSVIPKPSAPIRPPALPQVADASSVSGAIRKAARNTGASFEYLLATAKVESNLNPNLTVRTSSATGLFQFIEQTWLGVMKRAGKALGFGHYADAISRNPAGRYQVANPAMRDEIMQLRRNPAANAAMAGAFTQQNSATLSQRIGRAPSEAELYIAHFFGPAGATRLITAAGEQPRASAAAMFPAAARANRSIFYDRQGNARSVAGVYAELGRRYQVARAGAVPEATPTTVAGAHPLSGAAPAPDTAGTANALAVARPIAQAGQPQPTFRSLYQTAELRGPVAPVVSALWGTLAAGPSSDLQPITPARSRGGPLDLFQETRPDARGLFGNRS